MKRMTRRFSLDSSVGSLDNGGHSGKQKKSLLRRASDRGLEAMQLDMLEVNRNLQYLHREHTIEEESMECVDGSNTRNSFKNHNKTFHKVFPDIPESEDLVQAFTCALQKEVVYYGKLYISNHHICFRSSVLLKETKVCIEMTNIQAVKKKNTARVVPNALSVMTNDGEKYLFVSIRNREHCFKLLLTICPQIQVPMSNSPVSSLDIATDLELSSASSQDESRRTSLDTPVPLGSFDTDLVQESIFLPKSQSSGVEQPTEDKVTGDGSWITSATTKVKSFFSVRESSIASLLLIYLILVGLLLLASVYIGLRILALEEQLSSLGSLAEFSMQTVFRES
ncbi:GRAM domain-containing protein 2B [Denticeps clupeoides]|uniref:GRAM domain-containing protein n=1 Tax=Denticeps clupeoides TaxID=299321 RepID=A0AAY4D326_9TELE|nr:GRAM domain-containing protein 2B-like [Denticeps clupeoides]